MQAIDSSIDNCQAEQNNLQHFLVLHFCLILLLFPHRFVCLLDFTFISSISSVKTFVPVAITDAIGFSKSHRNLMPLRWNLIEANIIEKG